MRINASQTQKKHGIPPLPAAVLLISYMLYAAALYVRAMLPARLAAQAENPVLAWLQGSCRASRAWIALLAAAPAAALAAWLIQLVRRAVLRRREPKQHAARLLSTGEKLFWGMLCGSEALLFLIVPLVFGSPWTLGGAHLDLATYKTAGANHYEGPLRLAGMKSSADTPIPGLDNTRFYVFESSLGDLYCPAALYDGTELMRDSYRAEYLPKSRTLISLLDGDGMQRIGKNGFQQRAPAAGWSYGDLPIRRCGEVYGYDRLTEAGKKAFDLLYSEIFSEGVFPGGERTRSFKLPIPLSAEEYKQVKSLYSANTFYRCYHNFRYATDDNGPIETVYAGAVEYGGNTAENDYYRAFEERARAIVADIPQGLTDADKILYLCAYLAQKIRYEDGDGTRGPADLSRFGGLTVLAAPDEASTGYGALVGGRANCMGYTQAFDLLARLCGIATAPVFGRVPGGEHAWNTVCLEGEWYVVDATWADRGSSLDEAYVLADEEQLAATHLPVSYGDCTFIPPPRAQGRRFNALGLRGLRFTSAQEALAYLQAHSPARDEILPLALESGEAMQALSAAFDAGEAPGLLLSLQRGTALAIPQIGHVRRADYAPPVGPDFAALRAEIPYPGMLPADSALSRLPVLGDSTAVALTRALNELIGGYPLKTGFYHSPTAPDREFIAYTSMRRTAPVAWRADSTLHPAAFAPALTPFARAVSPDAPDGVLQEHLEETARRLFGESVPLEHRDIPDVNGMSPFAAAWRYDPECGVYVRAPVRQEGRRYDDLIVTHYQETEAGYSVIAAQLEYYDFPQVENALFTGYMFFGANTLLQPDDPAVPAYCRTTDRVRRIELSRMADGELRILSIGPLGADR